MTLTWCFQDEASAVGDALLRSIEQMGAWVPVLWHLEVVNSLLYAQRRARVTASEIKQKLTMLAVLPIQTDTEASWHAFHVIKDLALAEKLTAYDACYLELAMRRKLPIATKDTALINACERQGVDCISL